MRPILLALMLLSATPLAAQDSCPDGVVTHVFIDNRSIFDLDELGDPPFAWAYRLANRLHVKTKPQFLRRELLIGIGQCYDPFLVEESERLFRRFPFISRADVFGVRQPDGDWHIVVDTQDEWTTEVVVGAVFDGRLEVRSVEVAEKNLLGRGMVLGAFYRETDAVRLIGGRFFTPRLFNTRVDASLTGARTRIGNFVEQELFYPFVGETGRFAGRQLYRRRVDYFAYSVGTPDEPEHLLLPLDEQRAEATVAMRLGRPGNLTVVGIGFSRDRVAFEGFPGSVERVQDNRFGDREPAPLELAEALSNQTRYSAGTRVNFLLGQRNIGFVRRSGLDALDGVQDIEVGTEFSLTLGRSLGVLAGSDRPEDLYGRFRFYGASAPESFVLASALEVEGRWILSDAAQPAGWRDMLSELDLLFYWQSLPWARHTFFARIAGAGGWSLDQPYQLTLGGPTGVRGYHDEDYPGGQRIVFTAEDRIFFGWPYPDLFDLGATLFADVGRIWPGDVPFGVDSGWRAALGAGLRVGFPAGTRGVVRLDAALPLGPSAGWDDLVFRVSFGDLIGLMAGLEDLQLARSRRTGTGPDRFNPAR